MENKKTKKIGKREIPLTKDGLPNMIYLGKEERNLIRKYKEEQKKNKLKASFSDIQKILDNLQD